MMAPMVVVALGLRSEVECYCSMWKAGEGAILSVISTSANRLKTKRWPDSAETNEQPHTENIKIYKLYSNKTRKFHVHPTASLGFSGVCFIL